MAHPVLTSFFILKLWSFDLALIKIRDSENSGFSQVACLPEFDEDPVDDCQVANFFPNESKPSKVCKQVEKVLNVWQKCGESVEDV